MKILLLGDYSNYHSCLSQGFAAMGHEVTVASNGNGWMQTGRQIDISRRKGKLGGALLWLKLRRLAVTDLKGYDVVQLCTPNFVSLRPHRIKDIFDRIKRGNGAVMVSMLGTDSQYVQMCDEHVLRYTEWRIGAAPSPFMLANQLKHQEWLAPALLDNSRYIYDNVDGVVTCLYEYHVSCQRFIEPERLAYAGIPIAIPDHKIDLQNLTDETPLRIMLGCHAGREVEKGADRLKEVAQTLEENNHGRVKFDFVQNVPLAQFQQILDQSHIVLDQLYSYTPATTALMAMARGKCVVSGAEPEYAKFIGEKLPLPLINADPLDLEGLHTQLQGLVENPSLLRDYATLAPEFVRKHNSVDVVAQRFVDFWNKRL